MFQKNPWPLPPYPTPSTPWFRAAVGRWSPRSRPCWCRRPRGAFLGSARGPSPLVPPDFFARPRHTTLKNPGHRGRGYGRGSGRHKPQQKAREAPRFKYYITVETLVYPHTLWPVPPGFRRCIEPWARPLCKGAPATSSHARAEWARSIEYRVGPIVIAVRARFSGHHALRWVPELAKSGVSGRSRRPTVPAECGYPRNDRR